MDVPKALIDEKGSITSHPTACDDAYSLEKKILTAS